MVCSGNHYDAIIFGAGMGGLSCAYGLARSKWRCALVEKRSFVHFGNKDFKGGYGIQLDSAAFSCLEKLEFPQGLQQSGIIANNIEIYSHYPFRVGSLSMRHSQPYYLFRRGRVIDFLLNNCRALPNIDYFFDNSFFQHSFEDGLHKVKLADSSEISSNLIIDATGHNSPLLPKLYCKQELASDYSSVRGVINSKEALLLNLSLEFCDSVRIYLAADCHLVIYPIDDFDNYNIVLICSNKYLHKIEELLFYAIGRFKNKQARDILRYLLSRYVKDTENICIKSYRLYDNILGENFPLHYKGIALVGDSIYPVLPFLAKGASLAFCDASILVNLLTKNEGFSGKDGLKNLLSLYTSIRSPARSKTLFKSRFQAKINHGGFPLSAGRDIALMLSSRLIGLYYRYLLSGS